MRFTNKAKNKTYRSGSEEKIAKILRKNSIKFKYEAEVLEYELPAKVRKYWPDFKIPKGLSFVYIEFKGRFSSTDRKKLLAVRNYNPGIDLRIIFEQDRRFSKSSETYYSDWTKHHGFKYHVGINVPQNWIKEFK